MKIYIDLVIVALASWIISVFFMPLMSRLAVKVNLVDKPNYRKVHVSPVPVVGGVTIAITVLFALLVSLNIVPVVKDLIVILVGGYALLIMGVLDDRFDIKAVYKLAVQVLLAYLVASHGIRITSFFGLFSIGTLPVYLQYILTIMVITGVVNAYNLMDGIDGLAGTLLLLGSLVIASLAFAVKEYNLVILLLAISGAIIGFLRKNLSDDKIFMGDAGSLFLGFILVVSGIKVLNTTAVVDPGNSQTVLLIIGGLFIVPVLDSLRVYRERIELGYSPFKADKRHLHHLFLMFNITHKKATTYIFIFSLIMLTSIVVFSFFFPTTLVIANTLLLFVFVTQVLNLNKQMVVWKQRINEMEG